MGYSSQLPIIAKVITGLILSSGSTGVHELVTKQYLKLCLVIN